ncbi:MAG: long-chain-fatty-acid--CoA ligase [Deltaproteobacteria bacterium]|nr:long-chain-fatty-acid--CoA ligase [Deltaproteobacteria bacterium]
MNLQLIKGFPSTTGDDYPLNTITFIKGAACTFPEVEVASRLIDGTMLRYNYGQAYERIQQLANALVKLGIKPGDRVAVVEWNTHRYWELYQAISGIGAVLLQVNLRISGDDKVYVINHSEASYLFVNETLLPLIEPIIDRLETVKSHVIITDKDMGQVKTALAPVVSYEAILADEKPAFDWPMIDETSAYSACYTTGTTGKPKGVYYSHRCIYLHTVMMALNMNLSCHDVLLQTVPMFHANGWGVFFAGPFVGAKLVFPGMYTAETLNILVDLMIQEKVTFNGGAPAIFMPMLRYLNALPDKPKFDNLRMISGATEPPLSMMKGFAEFGVDIVHGYGATETTPLVTGNLLKPSLADLPEAKKWELRKKQGLITSGLDVKIVDTEGNEMPRGGETAGEILIRGPWITTSYYNDPRSEGAFKDGYWCSGDAGYIDKNGYLKVSDRFKDIIKSGGEWISSIDLENAIMAHPAVTEAAVVGLEHPQWQERPLALVVKNPGETVTKDDILEFITRKFAKWQLPDDVLFVDEIPKTSVGKFSKKDIRTQYEDFYLKEK